MNKICAYSKVLGENKKYFILKLEKEKKNCLN